MNLYIIITYKAKKSEKIIKFCQSKNEEKVMSPQPRKNLQQRKKISPGKYHMIFFIV